MARIQPLKQSETTPSLQVACQRHLHAYGGRITNMKATLGYSLLAFETYMQWYPLFEQVKKILGQRQAYFFAFSLSKASECSLYYAYFRKIIIDNGEDPENLSLTEYESDLVSFGTAIARYSGNIADMVYKSVARNRTPEEMLVLIAFAGQMIAANVLNNVIETEIDDYLAEYLPPVKSIWAK